MEATVTFKKVFKNDRGPWGLIDENEERWKGWDNVVQGVRENGTYKVTYKTEEYKGEERKLITSPPEEVGGGERQDQGEKSSPARPSQTSDQERIKNEDIAVQAMFKVCVPAFMSGDSTFESTGDVAKNLLVELRRAWRHHKKTQADPLD